MRLRGKRGDRRNWLSKGKPSRKRVRRQSNWLKRDKRRRLKNNNKRKILESRIKGLQDAELRVYQGNVHSARGENTKSQNNKSLNLRLLKMDRLKILKQLNMIKVRSLREKGWFGNPRST